MKKINLKLLFLSFIMIGLLSTNITTKLDASENGSVLSIGAIGGWVFDKPRLSDDGTGTKLTTNGKSIFGGGLTAEVSLPVLFSIELDMLYIQHKFFQDTDKLTSGSLQFPLLLRAHFIPFLNPGFGFYYSRVVTSWTVTTADSSSTTVNYGKNDFGFVVALGAGLPVSEAVNLVADLRYLRSLKDSGGSTDNSLKFSQLQFLVGIKLDI